MFCLALPGYCIPPRSAKNKSHLCTRYVQLERHNRMHPSSIFLLCSLSPHCGWKTDRDRERRVQYNQEARAPFLSLFPWDCLHLNWNIHLFDFLKVNAGASVCYHFYTCCTAILPSSKANRLMCHYCFSPKLSQNQCYVFSWYCPWMSYSLPCESSTCRALAVATGGGVPADGARPLEASEVSRPVYIYHGLGVICSFSESWIKNHKSGYIHRWALRWDLGCVNLASWLPPAERH